MEDNLVRKNYLLDPIDGKCLDEFCRKIMVVRIAWLLIKLEHLPLVDNYGGHFIVCKQLC